MSHGVGLGVGGLMVGYVDIGTGVSVRRHDCAPPATEAVVFVVVAVSSPWKVSVGYILVHGLSRTDKANLIRKCLLLRSPTLGFKCSY